MTRSQIRPSPPKFIDQHKKIKRHASSFLIGGIKTTVMSKRTIIFIILALLILGLLGWGTWWGKDQYDQQANAFSSFKSVVEAKDGKRYQSKLTRLKDQYIKLTGDYDKILSRLKDGRLFTTDKDALESELETLQEEIRNKNTLLDTLYYGSTIDEAGLDFYQERIISLVEKLSEVNEEDAKLAKEKMAGYRYRLKAYRDSMMLYLNQKKLLLDTLQAIQGHQQDIATDTEAIKAERDRLLSLLEAKDSKIDMMTSDTSGFSQRIRTLEDSLALLLNRKEPIQVQELRCYYIPKEKDKKGQIRLNMQPIHSANKVRAIHLEFTTNIPEYSDENKAEILMILNGTPIRNYDVIINNGVCNKVIDTEADKLELGKYKLEVKYAGKTIRTHEFLISKSTFLGL